MNDETAEDVIALADWHKRRKRSARIVAVVLALWGLCGACLIVAGYGP